MDGPAPLLPARDRPGHKRVKGLLIFAPIEMRFFQIPPSSLKKDCRKLVVGKL